MFFRPKKPTISKLKQSSTGIIFSVKSGKGLLQPSVIHDPHSEASIHTLSWQNSPLIRFYSDSWCPTCAEFIYAGFSDSEESAAQFLSSLALWNQPCTDIADAYTALTPLFTLFADGYYRLEERELYPTDGNGHFFWDQGNDKQRNPATAGLWLPDDDPNYQQGLPNFLLPSQPPSKFNRERAEYYRDKPNAHSIAWRIHDTWLCVLLDGHHKATAAALEGRAIKTWMISQPDSRTTLGEDEPYLQFYDGERLKKSLFQHQIPLQRQYKKLSSDLWEDYAFRYDDCYTAIDWPSELEHCAAQYPSLYTNAIISSAGDLSEVRINRMIATGQHDECYPEIMLQALFYSHSPLFINYIQFLMETPYCACHWPLAFQLLAQKRTPQADEFFLNFAINDDGERPELTKIMDDYFRQPSSYLSES